MSLYPVGKMPNSGNLIPVAPFHSNYFAMTDCDGVTTEYNWLKIPFIPFKFNAEEIPLIRRIKSLQDAVNAIESNFQNAMEEDVRNTIMVLVNYDGTLANLGVILQLTVQSRLILPTAVAVMFVRFKLR